MFPQESGGGSWGQCSCDLSPRARPQYPFSSALMRLFPGQCSLPGVRAGDTSAAGLGGGLSRMQAPPGSAGGRSRGLCPAPCLVSCLGPAWGGANIVHGVSEVEPRLECGGGDIDRGAHLGFPTANQLTSLCGLGPMSRAWSLLGRQEHQTQPESPIVGSLALEKHFSLHSFIPQLPPEWPATMGLTFGSG